MMFDNGSKNHSFRTCIKFFIGNVRNEKKLFRKNQG